MRAIRNQLTGTQQNLEVTSQKPAPRKLKYKSYKNIDISNTSFELSVELHELFLKFEVYEEGRIIGGPRIAEVNLRSW